MKTIVVQGIEFSAPEPYTAGHVLLDNEASALNQTYAENLRNNFAGNVKEAKEAHGERLPSNIVEQLRDEFESYAASYTFGVRRAGEVDPVRLVRNKAASFTEEQKRAMAEAMGLEYRPIKSKAA